jgi:hypothetical protein
MKFNDLSREDLEYIGLWAYYAGQVYHEFGGKMDQKEKKLLKRIQKELKK